MKLYPQRIIIVYILFKMRCGTFAFYVYVNTNIYTSLCLIYDMSIKSFNLNQHLLTSFNLANILKLDSLQTLCLLCSSKSWVNAKSNHDACYSRERRLSDSTCRHCCELWEVRAIKNTIFVGIHIYKIL